MRFARLLALLSLASAPLAAQGFVDPVRPVPQGSVTRVRTDVSVAITGRVARVTVEEYFLNNGPMLGEANYVYPLPPDAAFGGLSLWQGDQEMKGEMLDATQARNIYEEIVRRRRDPALVELAGYGLIRARMFPIAPGETKKVTLRYNVIVTRQGDALRFRYPVGGSAAGSAPRTIRFSVDSARLFGNAFSPTHQLATQVNADRLSITVSDTGAPRDLELFLPVRTTVGASLVTYRPTGDDGYFMLLLAPGAARADGAVQPRDIVAVLDVSGSMSGVKIDQAKAALRQLLGTLRESDRFRLVAFSSDVRRFATDWTVATGDARSRATEWVDALSADGGTNIAGALSEAFSARPADGHLGLVVFLTDGLPTVGESDPEKLVASADHDRGGYRVFSFGIGYDVNTYLLDRLTEQARGATEYIRPGDNIEQAVGALAAKVSSPVLTDVGLRASGGAEVYDLQPGQLPDLFAGDETVIMGRFRGTGTGEWGMVVTGRRNGSLQEFSAAADGAEHATNDYVARLWANRKAGALTREIRLHGTTPELLQSLKTLALRYGILTEYTAYLVQEPPTPIAQRAAEERMLNAPAPAPAASTGAGAVAKSRRDAAQLQAVTVEADAGMLDEMTRGRAGIAPTKRVGGRLFILRDSVWTDLGYKDGQRVVKVAPFSEAYFALLRALPELTKAATLGGKVLVAGSGVSVEIAPEGLDSWAPGQLAALVGDFR
jgi:Ca-activated chloride channel family protein